jgi:hypothetical protein
VSSSSTRRRALATVVTLVVAVLAAMLSTVPSASAAPAAPSGLTPSGSTVNGLPVLQWNRVSGATAYDVQVATSDTFNNLVWSTATYNRRATPNVQVPGGAVHWRVRAVGPTGTGPWANAAYTRQALAGPAPQAPADGEVLESPQEPALLSWSPLNGAVSYTLEVGTDPQFVDSTRYVSYTTQAASYVVPDPVVATEYYWRVKASLGSGVVTQWSTVRTYTVGGLAKPVLESPADSSATNVVDVVLDWEPVMGAKTYNLQISTDQNFNTVEHQLTGIMGTRYSPTSTLNNDQYYWRVSPVDSAGNTLAWTDVDVWEFRRHWPDQPSLEYPVHNSQPSNPFFYQWTPVRNASSYKLEVSTSPDFNPGAMLGTCFTVNTTFTPTEAGNCFPQALGTYYWRVTALDGPVGVVSDAISAEVRRFTYNPSLVSLSSPVDGASVELPTLRWQPTAGAAEYQLTITQVDNGNAVVSGLRTTGTSFTPRGKLTVGKSYRWQVQSVSASGRVGPGFLPASQPTFTVADSSATPGATPEPVTPAGTTSVRFPTLQWTPVTNATRYLVYVRPVGAVLWTPLNDQFEYPAGEDRGSSWLAPEAYEWRVEAYNGATVLSTTENPSTFVISALPSVTGQHVALSGVASQSPATSCDNALDPQLPLADQQCMDLRQTPVLTWDALPNAGRYAVVISRDQQLTNKIATYFTEQPTFTPPTALLDSQAGSAFYWHVQPCKVAASCKPLEHAQHAFNKLSKPVQLQSPAAGATVSNAVTFTWRDYLATNQDATTAGSHAGVHSVEPDVEAYNYRVQVDNDPNFQSPLDTVVVDQTTYTAFGNTYPEGPLYWRVQAIDGSGNPLSWSSSRTFTKRSPQVDLTAPVNNAQTSGVAPLRWQPLAYAASYDVEVYKDADTIGQAGNLVFSGNSKQVALTPTVPLAVSGQSYTWRVRPRDAAGRPGQWTDLADSSHRFRVVGAAPSLTSPQDNTLVVGTDALFTWTAVNGATDYRWDLRLQDGGGLNQIRTPGLAWAPSIVGNGNWEWRVVSLNSAGVEIGSSPWWQFRVDALQPAVSSVKPAGLVRKDANFQVTFSEPVRNVTKLTYKIFPSGSKRALTASVKPSADRRKATLNPAVNLKRGKTYVLRVLPKIKDDAGNRLIAYAWSVTVK